MTTTLESAATSVVNPLHTSAAASRLQLQGTRVQTGVWFGGRLYCNRPCFHLHCRCHSPTVLEMPAEFEVGHTKFADPFSLWSPRQGRRSLRSAIVLGRRGDDGARPLAAGSIHVVEAEGPPQVRRTRRWSENRRKRTGDGQRGLRSFQPTGDDARC
jgi:hypothetical protein